MTSRRRILLLGLVGALGAIGWMAATQIIANRVALQLKHQIPFGVTYESVHWHWPVGVSIQGFTVANPAGQEPYLLKVKKLTLTPPFWALLTRPLRVAVTLDQPHLMLNAENFGEILASVHLPEPKWIRLPRVEITQTDEEEKEPSPEPPIPLALFGLEIIDGQIDASAEDLRAGQPVFSLGHLQLSLKVSNLLGNPEITLEGNGQFLEGAKPIGVATVELKAQPTQNQMEGTLRLRHEQLRDFRLFYQYAPRPIFIDGGMADVTIQWQLWDASRVRVKTSCLVQNLDLDGKVGDVSWAQIMHAVEDEQRRYQWTASAEGRLDDPKFNPHDQILSEVEWMMKEKAAQNGLKIEGQMFFYEESPESQESSQQDQEAIE